MKIDMWPVILARKSEAKVVENDREAPQQAETVPRHFTQVASCTPGSILPPKTRAADGKRGALGDFTSKPESLRSKKKHCRKRARCDV